MWPRTCWGRRAERCWTDQKGQNPSAEGQTEVPARVRTSATTGEGIPELREEILRQVGGEAGVQAETGFLTNLRHQERVREALTALAAAKVAVGNKIPHEMVLLDFYNALRPLDEITGTTTNDDILNLIFSTFCVGK